jgi:uncharacterized membrane protein
MTEATKSFLKAIVGIVVLLLWTYQFIIVFLKLTNVVEWTWFWVLFPIFLQLTLVFLILMLILLVMFLLYFEKTKVKKRLFKQIKDNAEVLSKSEAEVLSKSEDFKQATEMMTDKEKEEINNLLNSVLTKNKSQRMR